MELASDILSQLTIYMKYARYLPEKKRRETWEELVTRNKNMHIKKFPKLKEEIEENYKLVYEKKVLPSMRGLQFGGKPIEISPTRGFNCSACAINHWKVFSEIMFLLLGGSGVGISVQRHHIAQLPEVKAHIKRNRRFLVNDSIEGWADAIKVLTKSYFFGQSKPIFDFSDIRPKGTPLKTSGGKAPGPQPLKDCIHHLVKIFNSKEPGTQLTSLECHDIVCHIADCVLAGGIRRAALISLFSLEDEEMLSCKHGNWWETNPQRGRANNSVLILRHKIKKKRFMELIGLIKEGRAGEPGTVLSNDKDWLFNPCGEASLRDLQFCNLTTIDVSNVEDQADLNARAKAAAFIGTLQAVYTDFHYLRDKWKKTTEREALLGVSMTGIASGKVFDCDLSEAAEIILEENEKIAKKLNVNKAARTTLTKPEGTSSLVVGSSSGIHGWFAPYYVRRVRVLKNEPIYLYLKDKIPELIEDDYFKKTTQAIISIPIKAPEGATFATESAIDLLERVKKVYCEWVMPGHRSGENTHNVSCFTGDTKFLTEKGYKNFNDFKDGDKIKVVGYDGKLKPALVKHFGKQKIWTLKLSNGQSSITIRTTRNHLWFTSSRGRRFRSKDAKEFLGYQLRNTSQLSEKTYLPNVLPQIEVPKLNLQALLHGIVFGDGTTQKRIKEDKCSINLCNDPNGCDSRKLSHFFQQQGFEIIDHPKREQIYIGRLPGHWKALPQQEDPDYIYWFIAGWFASDGHVTRDTSKRSTGISLSSKYKHHMEWLINKAPIAGIATTRHIGENIQTVGYNPGETYYRICFIKSTLTHNFFVLEDKLKHFQNQKVQKQSHKRYRVIEVKEEGYYEDVYCVIEPKNAAFVIDGYILTHNCTVFVGDDEWDQVGKWMWENRKYYNGITVLPRDGGTYKQAPFEKITKKQYEEMYKLLTKVNLEEVAEHEDNTNLQDQQACGGSGSCEII